MSAFIIFCARAYCVGDGILGLHLIVSYCDCLRLIVGCHSSLQDECVWCSDKIWCKAGTVFGDCGKQDSGAPLAYFSNHCQKRYDMGNEATYNARIGLINETRRNPPTIYFFCGLSLNTVKSRRCDFRGKQEKNISFENRYHPDVDQNPIKNENKAWFLHSRFICLVRHDRKSWLPIAQYSFLHVNRQACFKTMKVCSGGSLYIDVSDIAP